MSTKIFCDFCDCLIGTHSNNNYSKITPIKIDKGSYKIYTQTEVSKILFQEKPRKTNLSPTDCCLECHIKFLKEVVENLEEQGIKGSQKGSLK